MEIFVAILNTVDIIKILDKNWLLILVQIGAMSYIFSDKAFPLDQKASFANLPN